MISASIVLYKTEISELQILINCLLSSETKVKIYLVDNSPTNVLKEVINHKNIEYIHNPSNPGFGAAHNLSIEKSIKAGNRFHFIVNPDIYFEKDILTPMIKYIETDESIGLVMPQVLNLDGSVQFLPKLVPSLLSIILRKISRSFKIFQRFLNNYELRFLPKDKIYNAPIITGCFTLLNLKAIQELGSYDDKFFMYFEDWDLSRRIHKNYKTIYYPKVSVFHGYNSSANKSFKYFIIYVRSAIIYFNKWGWFFDNDRAKINSNTIEQFK